MDLPEFRGREGQTVEMCEEVYERRRCGNGGLRRRFSFRMFCFSTVRIKVRSNTLFPRLRD